MEFSDKKILHLTVEDELFGQIKNGAKKSEFREYKKQWKEQFTYPCGTIKNFDFVLLQNKNQPETLQMMVEFKGIKVIKKKKNWFKTNRLFEIELGNVVEEIK